MIKVAKFGGTSLADSTQIRKVAGIIAKSDPAVVVVSAPGKRFPSDIKITDILLDYAKTHDKSLVDAFAERVIAIEKDLSISSRASDYIKENYAEWKTADEAASRGEYVSGLIVSEYVKRDFLDPFDYIEISDDSLTVCDATYGALAKAIDPNKKYVMPGFYGKGSDGKIKTFTRGGSDTTGSVVARAIKADVYENYTDVSGVFNANPKLIEKAMPISELSYAALRSLAENGTEVFCFSAIRPVENLIPIHVLNTNKPEELGTKIVNNDSIRPEDASKPVALTKNGNDVVVVCCDGTAKNLGACDIASQFDRIFG
ncbi:MAG TPA: hypothetical protein DCO86_00585 [Spirochaetaceae bacterium]|nr:hypothetical protein [Spirochaetaceae bacterium]